MPECEKCDFSKMLVFLMKNLDFGGFGGPKIKQKLMKSLLGNRAWKSQAPEADFVGFLSDFRSPWGL